MSDLISQSEFARRLGIDRRKVYGWREDGGFHLVQGKVDFARACEQLGQYWDERDELMTQSAYAKRIGVSASYVTKKKAEGVIPLFAGKVHPEIADLAMAADRDPSMPLKRKGTPDPDVLVVPRTGSTPRARDEDTDGLSDAERYQHYRAELTEQQARKAKLDADEKEGDLISRAEVARQAYQVHRVLQQSLLGIPDRIAAELVSMTEPRAIIQHLRREIEQSLTLVADELDRTSTEGDEEE